VPGEIFLRLSRTGDSYCTGGPESGRGPYAFLIGIEDRVVIYVRQAPTPSFIGQRSGLTAQIISIILIRVDIIVRFEHLDKLYRSLTENDTIMHSTVYE
jgi:hypothetical protein